MHTLYDYLDSGNGYKVRLVLSLLDIPYRRVELDIDRGETRTPQFLAKNANGRIPTLELDDGGVLAESNAIMFFLATDSAYLPDDPWLRAQVLQWMFFEQYSHEPAVAVARYILRHTADDSPRRAELPMLREKGMAALEVMESHLASRHFFVAERFTIADIALYAYTHVAHQGGFDLSGFPAVNAWLDRVGQQPGHVPMMP